MSLERMVGFIEGKATSYCSRILGRDTEDVVAYLMMNGEAKSRVGEGVVVRGSDEVLALPKLSGENLASVLFGKEWVDAMEEKIRGRRAVEQEVVPSFESMDREKWFKAPAMGMGNYGNAVNIFQGYWNFLCRVLACEVKPNLTGKRFRELYRKDSMFRLGEWLGADKNLLCRVLVGKGLSSGVTGKLDTIVNNFVEGRSLEEGEPKLTTVSKTYLLDLLTTEPAESDWLQPLKTRGETLRFLKENLVEDVYDGVKGFVANWFKANGPDKLFAAEEGIRNVWKGSIRGSKAVLDAEEGFLMNLSSRCCQLADASELKLDDFLSDPPNCDSLQYVGPSVTGYQLSKAINNYRPRGETRTMVRTLLEMCREKEVGALDIFVALVAVFSRFCIAEAVAVLRGLEEGRFGLDRVATVLACATLSASDPNMYESLMVARTYTLLAAVCLKTDARVFSRAEILGDCNLDALMAKFGQTVTIPIADVDARLHAADGNRTVGSLRGKIGIFGSGISLAVESNREEPICRSLKGLQDASTRGVVVRHFAPACIPERTRSVLVFVPRLLAAVKLSGVVVMDLSDIALGDAGAKVLLKGLNLASLKKLSLARNFLTRNMLADVREFLASGRCEGLELLDLSGNSFLASDNLSRENMSVWIKVLVSRSTDEPKDSAGPLQPAFPRKLGIDRNERVLRGAFAATQGSGSLLISGIGDAVRREILLHESPRFSSSWSVPEFGTTRNLFLRNSLLRNSLLFGDQSGSNGRDAPLEPYFETLKHSARVVFQRLVKFAACGATPRSIRLFVPLTSLSPAKDVTICVLQGEPDARKPTPLLENLRSSLTFRSLVQSAVQLSASTSPAYASSAFHVFCLADAFSFLIAAMRFACRARSSDGFGPQLAAIEELTAVFRHLKEAQGMLWAGLASSDKALDALTRKSEVEYLEAESACSRQCTNAFNCISLAFSIFVGIVGLKTQRISSLIRLAVVDCLEIRTEAIMHCIERLLDRIEHERCQLLSRLSLPSSYSDPPRGCVFRPTPLGHRTVDFEFSVDFRDSSPLPAKLIERDLRAQRTREAASRSFAVRQKGIRGKITTSGTSLSGLESIPSKTRKALAGTSGRGTGSVGRKAQGRAVAEKELDGTKSSQHRQALANVVKERQMKSAHRTDANPILDLLHEISALDMNITIFPDPLDRAIRPDPIDLSTPLRMSFVAPRRHILPRHLSPTEIQSIESPLRSALNGFANYHRRLLEIEGEIITNLDIPDARSLSDTVAKKYNISPRHSASTPLPIFPSVVPASPPPSLPPPPTSSSIPSVAPPSVSPPLPVSSSVAAASSDRTYFNPKLHASPDPRPRLLYVNRDSNAGANFGVKLLWSRVYSHPIVRSFVGPIADKLGEQYPEEPKMLYPKKD